MMLSLLLIASCGNKSRVTGKVLDKAGKGIDSVMVLIEKSNFKTITDKQGNYSIDYAPGTFKIIYSKTGYTTHELELNLSNKTKYPAETVELYPIPKNKGIYLFEGNKLIPLKETYVKERTGRDPNQDWGNYSLYQINNLNKIVKETKIKAGTIKFIDTNPEAIKVACLQTSGDIGIIQYYTYNWSNPKYKYNGLINDNKKRVGKEKLLIRSVQVKPGTYAWVQVGKTFDGRYRPIGNKKCFVFNIVPSEEK